MWTEPSPTRTTPPLITNRLGKQAASQQRAFLAPGCFFSCAAGDSLW